jgi:hypothetical protein
LAPKGHDRATPKSSLVRISGQSVQYYIYHALAEVKKKLHQITERSIHFAYEKISLYCVSVRLWTLAAHQTRGDIVHHRHQIGHALDDVVSRAE